MNLPRMNRDALQMMDPPGAPSSGQMQVAMAQMQSRPAQAELEAADIANMARHMRRQSGMAANTAEAQADQFAQSYAAALLNVAGDAEGMGANGPMTRLGQLAQAGITPDQLAASMGY